jgi:hypothetical protein
MRVSGKARREATGRSPLNARVRPRLYLHDSCSMLSLFATMHSERF